MKYPSSGGTWREGPDGNLVAVPEGDADKAPAAMPEAMPAPAAPAPEPTVLPETPFAPEIAPDPVVGPDPIAAEPDTGRRRRRKHAGTPDSKEA